MNQFVVSDVLMSTPVPPDAPQGAIHNAFNHAAKPRDPCCRISPNRRDLERWWRRRLRPVTSGECSARYGRRAEHSTHGFATMESSTLLAFRRRDANAVRALYRAYGNLVYAVAHRYLGRHDLAEDAVQQTFVRAWQSADRLDVDRDPAPWLATIAKHTAIDIYRREARRPTTVLTDEVLRNRTNARASSETLDAVWHVRRAIDALPADEATIVRLQHIDGMTQLEISERLGVALGTVKSRSHRAHRKLAGLLGHLHERPHD